MKTAIIYARYSSERQSEQSIDGQLRVCNDFAQRNGLKIVGTYIDRAMTGTNDHRAEFQRMLSDSDTTKEWDIVLVYALDRFGRNSIEIAINKQRLKKNGKILISATQRTSQNIDGSQNLDGIILENVMIGIAEYSCGIISKNQTRSARKQRKRQLCRRWNRLRLQSHRQKSRHRRKRGGSGKTHLRSICLGKNCTRDNRYAAS